MASGLLEWLKTRTQPTMTIDQRRAVVDASAARTHEGVIERYAQRGEIARGGMGSVRKVTDAELLRTCAMKVLQPPEGSSPEHLAHAARTFVEEAQITAQLDHPNIVPIYEMGRDAGGTHFFTMKMVRGRTLKDMIHADGYDPCRHDKIAEVLDVLRKVCDALSFAHARGVVHRDLKPENIMVGDFGQVYLMDFGVAKLLAAGHERDEQVRVASGGTADPPGAIVGTLHYMAPEQARGDADAIDERTDVFGVGAILYEALLQIPPIYGRTLGEVLLMAQSGQVRPPQELADGVVLPAGLCAICERALHADKAQRYQSVAELKKDLDAYLMGGMHLPTRNYAVGDVIVTEGEPGEEAFILQRGFCRVFKEMNGEMVFVADLGPGQVFGETAVFAGGNRTATVQAITDVTVQVVSRPLFETELTSSIGLFVKALAERYVAADRELRQRKAADAQASPPGHAQSHRPSEPTPTIDPALAAAAALVNGRSLAEVLGLAVARGLVELEREARTVAAPPHNEARE